MCIACTCDKGIFKFHRILKLFVYMSVHVCTIENCGA